MKAQAAINSARESIPARAIDGVLSKNTECGKGNDAGQFSQNTEVERRQKESGVDRDQKGNRNQEAEQKLQRWAVLFGPSAGFFGIRQEKGPHTGHQQKREDPGGNH